jgi:omega-hydroxy-beta-dihydromenaquinone-9 sulfotransferase
MTVKLPHPSKQINMALLPWLRLLYQHRLRIHPRGLPTALRITMISLVQSGLGFIQKMVHGKSWDRPLTSPPIIIVGYWRSGTTFLHEMLCQDRNHAYPNTFECMNPCHFQLTEQQYAKTEANSSSISRPMDDMTISFTSPQEDEFALLALGAPSVYASLLFPGDLDKAKRTLTSDGLSKGESQRWIEQFKRFLSGVASIRPGRMVVKSPSHSFKLSLILKAFPDAKVIHIERNPYRVFISARRMWQEMFKIYGLQSYEPAELDRFILETRLEMEGALSQTVASLPASQYQRVTYEELVANPTTALRHIYDTLGLGDFEQVLPILEKYWADTGEYTPSQTALSQDDQEQVDRAWAELFPYQPGFS